MDKPKTALITKPIWRGSRVHLPWPALFHGRQRRKCAVRFLLIPVGYGCDILRERAVAAVPQAQCLHLHTDILRKTNAIVQVPAVKAKFSRAGGRVQSDQRHTEVGLTKRLFTIPAILRIKRGKTEGTAKLVFGSIIRHGGLVGVPIMV